MVLRMTAMAAGIALVSLFPQLPPLQLVPFGLLLACCLVYCGCWLPACSLMGICWGVFYGYQVFASQLPGDWQQSLLRVEGEVVGLPEISHQFDQSVIRFQLKLDKPVCKTQQDCQSGLKRVNLNWYDPPRIIPGQRWRVSVSLKRPYGMANPGGFDYQSWLIQQGVGGVGRVVSHPHNQLMGESGWSIDYLRWQLASLIDEVAAQLPQRPIIKALAIGDKRGITRQQWQLFAETGTTHLLVISGLHIGLVCWLLFSALRILVLLLLPPLSAERWAAFFAMMGSGVYALSAGFTLPTQRALIMIVVVMLTLICRRYIAATQGLALALLLCLLHNPLAPVSFSFWLSFGAVSCLLYGSCGRYPAVRSFTKLLSAQCLVFIGLMPLLAILLGQLSYLSPLANLLLVPLFSFIVVPLNFIAASLVAVDSSLSFLLWSVVDGLLSLSLNYLGLLSSLAADNAVYIGSRPWPVNCLALLGVLLLLLPVGMPAKFLAVILLTPLIFYQPPKLAAGDLRFTVLDVGQGLAIVINTREHTLVYDLGPKLSDDFDTATAVVVPFLRHQGEQRIDRLVLSHGDNDHAGAWELMLEQIETGELLYGEKPEAPLPYGQFCSQASPWLWDRVRFQFFSLPETFLAGNSNNRSCVLKITAGDLNILLPGDVESLAELALIHQYDDLLAADILVAPHHGSKSSSSWPFVKKVDPQSVIVSSGYRNAFRHPHPDIVDRYHALGIHIYQTAHSGALTFNWVNGTLTGPESYRDRNRRYWLQGSD